jgi:hypothetical protein
MLIISATENDLYTKNVFLYIKVWNYSRRRKDHVTTIERKFRDFM